MQTGAPRGAVDLPVGAARRVREGRAVPEIVAALRSERDALVERIRHAMAAPTDAATSVLEPSVLARGERATSEWLASLQSLSVRREGGMRAAPVLVEQLWALLSDPRAASSIRAGAAVVLASHADESTREKLRVAAQSVAAPGLRIVLEAAAKGETTELVRVLDDVPDERAGAARGAGAAG